MGSGGSIFNIRNGNGLNLLTELRKFPSFTEAAIRQAGWSGPGVTSGLCGETYAHGHIWLVLLGCSKDGKAWT